MTLKNQKSFECFINSMNVYVWVEFQFDYVNNNYWFNLNRAIAEKQSNRLFLFNVKFANFQPKRKFGLQKICCFGIEPDEQVNVCILLIVCQKLNWRFSSNNGYVQWLQTLPIRNSQGLFTPFDFISLRLNINYVNVFFI